jgi:hypothetical protein
MNTQDLKDNRTEIISHIESRGYDLKFAMGMAVEIAANCDTVEELLMELDSYCKPVKETKLASLVAKIHEGEVYNPVTKRWVKENY